MRLWTMSGIFITNRSDLSAAEVWFCNKRGNQENLIEQLKNGLNAPVAPYVLATFERVRKLQLV